MYNEPQDISWLKDQIKGNIFDLYCIVTINGKKKCFCCVQCKTSIYDRSIWMIIWGIGAVACLIFFSFAYVKCYLEFRTSLPVNNEFIANWKREQPLLRKMEIRQSDRIFAPLTYGILRPVILMPRKTDWDNKEALQYVLMHEYISKEVKSYIADSQPYHLDNINNSFNILFQ